MYRTQLSLEVRWQVRRPDGWHYLGVDLANEVQMAAEIVDPTWQIVCGIALKSGTQGRDTRAAVEAEPFANEVVGADEIGPQPDRRGHSTAGGVTVTGEPQLLHGPDVLAVALAGECFVVVIGRRRTHRAECEGVTLSVATSGLLDVVGELDPDRHSEIKIRERPTRTDRTIPGGLVGTLERPTRNVIGAFRRAV